MYQCIEVSMYRVELDTLTFIILSQVGGRLNIHYNSFKQLALNLVFIGVNYGINTLTLNLVLIGICNCLSSIYILVLLTLNIVLIPER